MMTDLYQLTMMYGYYKCGMRDNLATFDMFYRSKDATTHYAIMAAWSSWWSTSKTCTLTRTPSRICAA